MPSALLSRRQAAALAIVLLLVAGDDRSQSQQPQQPSVGGPTRTFYNARIIDGDGKVVAANGSFTVRDGRITGVANARIEVRPNTPNVVDLAGRTVMPGMVNAHGHVGETSGLQTGAKFYTDANLLRQLRQYASYGVTTVMSLGGDAEAGFKLRDAQATPALDRARLFVAGPVISATTAEVARKDVDRVAAMKPDIIKIRVDDNLGTATKMPLEAATAVIDQAHKHGLRVAAHVFYLDDTKALLKAGVDLIAHSVRDQPVDDELIGLMKSRGVCVCPTLMREVSTFVYESEPEFFKDPFFLRAADPEVLELLRDPSRQAQMRANKSAQRYKVALDVALANTKKLFDAGILIASGTDTGPPARFQGYFEHMELDLLAKAGLPPAAIIAAATGNAARCSRLTDVGFLRPGQWGDFVVLNGNPLESIAQTKTIDSVYIAGNRITR
jgi:imidazolonepropionase-like amidohydrolase